MVSVGSATSSLAATLFQPAKAPEATEAAGAPERDGDGDDGKQVQAVTAPKPTVNTQGQAVGTTINVTA